MSERVTMPALGESVTEGTVTRWLKSVGDSVAVDEPLLEVSTDKVDTEIPSPVAGTLQEILVEEDETVEVGAALAVIGDGDAPSGGGDTAQDRESGASDASGAEAHQASEPEPEVPAAPSTEAPEPPGEPGPSSGGGEVSGGETVPMPALGESVTEGTVTRWLKQEGDEVAVDEPLLEVSTDKVDTEIPSPVAGTVTKILVGEDETVEVGAALAIIGGERGGGGAPEPEPAAAREPEPEPEPAPAAAAKPEQPERPAPPVGDETAEEAKPKGAPKPQAEPAREVSASSPSRAEEQDASSYVTPLVRKLAADHGVDLSTLKGTGVGGRIRKQDVLDAAKSAQEAKDATGAGAPPPKAAAAPAAGTPAPAGRDLSAKRGTTEKMSRLRSIIAQRMVESLQVSAQLTATVEVDMSQVATLRARTKADFEAREGVKLSYLPFISVAAVETLKQFPQLNASVEGGEIQYHAQENLGVAVDTERGLLVPVVKDAGDLNIAGMARKIADLAERTRTNKVGPDELSGGTFTITNLGSNGSLLDTPIINQPQVAILGTGAIVKRPVVVLDEHGSDSIAIRSMMYLCLTYDHRAIDGADAGRFLTALKRRLEEGSFEV